MTLFPEIALSRMLHRQCVERPVAAMLEMRPADVIWLFVFAALALSAAEMIAVLGTTEMIAAMAWDIALYVEALTFTALARGRMRLSDLRLSIEARLMAVTRRSGSGRAPRRQVRKERPNADNDDGPGDPVLLLRCA